MRIIMLGPPGSGKGTCAHIISEIYDIPVITTGDMLRNAVTQETDYGKIAEDHMIRGELVPDKIVNGIVKERFNELDLESGFILDGYPRNLVQAKFLDEFLSERNLDIDHVIYVILEDDKIIERLSLRRSCPKCGAVYHLKSNPPSNDLICDNCGTQLVQREDDKVEVIRNRLEVYRRNTKPLLDRYAKEGKTSKFRGDNDLEDLPKLLKKLLS